jgi:hypothetical protein
MAGHPDLAPSVVGLWEPPEILVGWNTPVPDAMVATRAAHSVATGGLLTAEGDNASGIAGASWRSRLHLYSGYGATNRPLDLGSDFGFLASQVVSDGIRVLSISADVKFSVSTPPEQRAEYIRDLQALVKESLLDQLPNLVVVVAAGNERSRSTPAEYYRDSLVGPLRAALLLLREDPAYRDRIIVVAGTEDGNRFWDTWVDVPELGSNFFPNATDVAAPALEVSVLGPWHHESGPAVPVAVETGTSLSAPLVAGVAAQLLAMDSTLTPAEVKSYILRGASEQRPSSTTGGMVQPLPVQGAPETIYQLDAYGALSLLSRERPGTPICGYPVSFTPDYGSVVLERPGAPVTLAVPGGNLWGVISVAQGGRLMSVVTSEVGTVTPRSVLMDQTGRVIAVVPDVQRTFLERDTLDAAWDYTGLGTVVYTLRPGSGGPPRPLQPLARLAIPPEEYPCDGSWLASSWQAFSPSGEWVAVHLRRCGLEGRPVQIWMVPTDPAGSPRLVEAEANPGATQYDWGWSMDKPSDIEWSHDSRRAIYFTTRYNPYGPPWFELLVTSVGTDGVPHDTIVADNTMWSTASQTFSADDSAVVTMEMSDESPSGVYFCTERRHDPRTWAALAGARDVGTCEGDNQSRIFPNAPPLRAGVVRGGPASPGSHSAGERGFGLGAPAVALERSAARLRALFPRALRVQVN